MKRLGLLLILLASCLLPRVWAATADEYYRAGLALAQQGQHEKAVQDYQAALQMDPHHWQSAMALGNSFYSLQRLPEAVVSYDRSLADHPDNQPLRTFVEKLRAAHPELPPAPLGSSLAVGPTPIPTIAPLSTVHVSKTALLDPQWVIWVGPAFLPYKMTGVRDVDLSDWEYYGSGFLEGRIGLPLGKAEGTKTYVGGEIGGEFYFKPRLSALMEARLVFKNALTSQMAILVGGAFHFVQTKKFSLAIAPKIGYGSIDVDFGNTYVLPGYTPPVVLPEGTIYDGTDITAHSGGLLVEGALQGSIRFSERIGLYGRVGYMKSFMNELQVDAGGVTIANNSPAMVNPGAYSAANLKPQAAMDGFTAMFGIAVFH